ncbi:MAG: hypothetical protein AAB920_02280 [Patescibacteria group bacterium]
MNPLSKIISGFFKDAEKLLLIEQYEDGYYVTSAISRASERTLLLTDRYRVSSLDAVKLPPAWVGAWDRAILALHSSSATTVEGVVNVVRDRPREMITEGELDAMLFKAFWSFLNRYRPFAAKKFNTNELDPVVANIAVCGVSLGDHKVFNPLDFSGANVTIRFRGTFVPREILIPVERLSKFVKGNMFVVERGTILSVALNQENAFIDIGDATTTIYMSYKGESAYLHELEWGVGRIMKAIAKFFGVSESIVPEILRRYTKNQVSEKVRRTIERIVKEEVRELHRLITPTLQSAGMEKHSLLHYTLRTHESLPQALVDEFGFARVAFSEMLDASANAYTAKHGILAMRPDLERQSFVLLGYPYLHPQYAFLNQLLRRRVRWLVPSAAIKN